MVGGFGSLNSNGYHRSMHGHDNQLNMFNGGHPKGGMGGYHIMERISGYPKGGIMGGYSLDAMGGYHKGGMEGYHKGVMGGHQIDGMVGHPKGGMGGYHKGGMGGYHKGSMGGHHKGGMGGYHKGGVGGYHKGSMEEYGSYLKAMMYSGLYPGFDRMNGFSSGHVMDFHGNRGYSKLGNGRFGVIGGAVGIKGFRSPFVPKRGN